MRLILAVGLLAAGALAACPNQCSGHGWCDSNDRCMCYRAPGTKGNLRPMYTGADCSQRVCPYGDSHDFISDQGQQLQPVQYGYDAHYGSSDPYVGFLPATVGGAAPSMHHMHAFLNNGFLLNRDLGLDVKVVSVNNAGASSSLVFQWKLNTEKTYNQEQTLSYNNGIGSYLAQSSAYHVRPDLGAGPIDSGLYLYFDLTANDFSTPTVYAGDRYYLNVTFNEGKAVRPNDDNTAHPLMECSGRGTCDRTAGVCGCTTGYTGDACQRTLCPSACSGHGTCQSLQFFYDEGRGGNGDVYSGVEASQQYGCSCDSGFRGSACDQIECPSGPDPLGGDGGAQGRDCSGRGTCDYTSGTCACFKGFFGERCEEQTNLI